MVSRLKSGPNLGPRRVIPYSPTKLLKFICCCIQKSVDEAWSSRSLDGSIFLLQRRLLPESYAFCDLYVKTTSFFTLKVCSSIFELFKDFKPDFEAISLNVRELLLD